MATETEYTEIAKRIEKLEKIVYSSNAGSIIHPDDQKQRVVEGMLRVFGHPQHE